MACSLESLDRDLIGACRLDHGRQRLARVVEQSFGVGLDYCFFLGGFRNCGKDMPWFHHASHSKESEKKTEGETIEPLHSGRAA